MVYKVLRGEDLNRVEHPIRISATGFLLSKDVQSAIEYSSSEVYGPWPDGAAQYTGYEHVYPIPTTYDLSQKYFVYVANPSPDTALTMSVRNEVEMFGGTVYAQIGQNGTSGTITVPAASYTLFSSTAWSGCVTVAGGIAADESTDINDANPAGDVPWAFSQADDAIYFGNATPFQRARFNIQTAGKYVATTVWEYWNGSAWTAIPEIYDTTNATVTNGSASFKRTGSRYIQWQVPDDWTAAAPGVGSAVNQYWVRCRIASFTSNTTPAALSQGWYKRIGTANVHGYLIEGLWNGGDCKITLENATAVPAGSGFQAEVYIRRM